MTTYKQSDATISVVANACLGFAQGVGNVMSVGATLGIVSFSSDVGTAGIAKPMTFFTTPFNTSDPGTATWMGACTMRFNVTTANTNVTWSGICWSEWDGVLLQPVTQTSTLAISLGTTGIKTASVEATAAYVVGATTASVSLILTLIGSNAATMVATFNWKSDQTVTLPFTSSAAPAPSSIFTLAQMNVGS